jgi:hypothetical protein
MKFTAKGGTDVAMIVLFWPDNLPDDADEMLEDDPAALIERMHSVGKLVAFPCDADGEYSVGVFLDEEIPPDLFSYCRDEQRMPRLIASGEGYFGGAEYVFKGDATLLEQYPSMCQPIEIPAGTFEACVYRTELPEDLHDSWLLEQAGPRAIRMWEWQTTLVGLSISLVFAVFIAWLFVDWMIWYGIIIAAAVSIFAAMGIARTSSYKAVVAAREEFKRAFPSYVLKLESPGSD